MKKPSSRVRRIATLGTAPVAIIVAGLLVWQGSNAAFTAQTRSVGNNWATGSVTLSDDDAGGAMFQVQNATPGDTGANCITVTSTSNVPGVVKAYLERLGSQGLEDHIIVTTESGTGGGFGTCTGFTPDGAVTPSLSLEAAAAVNYDYATGGTPWTTSGTPGESKTYRVSWEFDTTGLTQSEVDALQGKSVSADVVWELQSS
jgi:hypothetical protein